MGDFNIVLNSDSHLPTDEFLDSLNQFYYTPHILQPTCITHHSATPIDNIFFNSTEHHTISGNLIYDLSDHLPNFIVNKFSTLLKKIKITKRDYSNYEKKLLLEFSAVDWESVFDNTDDFLHQSI